MTAVAEEPIRVRMPMHIGRPVIRAASSARESRRLEMSELELIGRSATRLTREPFARVPTFGH